MARVTTVFGGAGFIGRYVVARLARQGDVVRVVGRDPNRAGFLMTAGHVAQIVPMFASFDQPATVDRVVRGADRVVNLVGILAEARRGQFDAVHARGAGMIAEAASRAGASGLVHVSAIGADPDSPSAYARSKAGGEAAVRAAFPAAAILRPSVVFGAEDKFFNMFAAMVRLLPFAPVVSPRTRLQPVYVGDVAAAVAAAFDRPGERFELGGPDVLSMHDVMRMVLRITNRDKRLVTMPMGLLTLQAAIAERLPGQLLTRDQLILLRRDNVVAAGAQGLSALGIEAASAELVVPDYLLRYRQGGLRAEPRLLPTSRSASAPRSTEA